MSKALHEKAEKRREKKKTNLGPCWTQEETMQTPLCSFKTVVLLLLPILVTGDGSADLAAVLKEFFEWYEQQSPRFSTEVGSCANNDRLTDLSIGVLDTQRAKVQEFINTTSAIDRSQLTRQQQYSYDTFMDTLNTFVNNYAWRYHGPLNPINFLEGFYLDLDSIINVTPFNTRGDFENYIARLEAWPAQIDQMMDRMNKAIEMRTTNHEVSMKAVPGQISAVINTAAHESLLYKPFNDTLDALQHISQAVKDNMRSRAQTALQNLWTALGRLKTFIEDTYYHNTRATYGVGGLPSGRAYYRACLQWHLSLNMTPEQVHQTGLQEVDRITQLMRQVMTRQGFSGTISEYYNELKTDPQFQMSSTDEIIKAYEDLIYNRINPKLPELFKDIPPSQAVVKPLPYDGPSGIYLAGSEDGSRPGTFYLNLFRPNETKTYGMVSLALHEVSPGHHLQSVYQLAAGLPKFQKYSDYIFSYPIPYSFPTYTAYIEGWALYAEYLGEEMGVYTDDYEMMGRYGDEIFRACRLVVDTGLHYHNWSRERAIQYLSERTPMPQSEVEIEVDRYLTWPGQACAYKIGELKIKELRQKAATALGSQFDIRDFHSLLLNSGPVPLSVMETIVDDYIADQKKLTGTAPRFSISSTGMYFLLALLLFQL